MAFQSSTGERVRRLDEEGLNGQANGSAEDKAAMPPPALPTFQKQLKKKKDTASLLGIKD